MHDFRYIKHKLYCEQMPVSSLVKKFGTPLYIYSQRTLTDHYMKLERALRPLDHLICFALKANSNAAVLRTMANLGSGFDIVSEGELRRVIAAGGDVKKCVFAGVGKTEREIEFALRQGIYSFNVESEPALASGSPAWWKGAPAKHILTPARYAATLVPLLQPLGLRILVEPGRFIVGNAGILVTRVEYVKRTGRKNFVIVDAAMNDLIRPAFYDSYHEIVPLLRNGDSARVASDVVGPICESGDFFCKDRPLPKVSEGDH